MFEKITIGIAVVAFFVISVISPPHIIMCGAVIIIALTCALANREKEIQELLGERKRLQSETLRLISNIDESKFSEFSQEEKVVFTNLLIRVVIRLDDQNICLSCARVIIKMGTEDLVKEEMEREDLDDDEITNLQKLLQAIKKLSGEQIPDEEE